MTDKPVGVAGASLDGEYWSGPRQTTQALKDWAASLPEGTKIGWWLLYPLTDEELNVGSRPPPWQNWGELQ